MKETTLQMLEPGTLFVLEHRQESARGVKLQAAGDDAAGRHLVLLLPAKDTKVASPEVYAVYGYTPVLMDEVNFVIEPSQRLSDISVHGQPRSNPGDLTVTSQGLGMFAPMNASNIITPLHINLTTWRALPDLSQVGQFRVYAWKLITEPTSALAGIGFEVKWPL